MAELSVTVNGMPLPLDGVAPSVSLLDALRAQGLTGAKEGCAEGECGACSVLVARPASDGGSQWVAVNACLPPALSYAGQEIVTAEGLGSPGDLHPVQAELAHRGGSQCGYCTPGFVCSMAAEYYRPDRAGLEGTEASGAGNDHHDHHDRHDHGPNGFDEHALSGNLCRCTGYRPIMDAAHALGTPAADDPFAARRAQAAPEPVPAHVSVAGYEYVRPETLTEALDLLAAHPDAVPVAGSTDLGVVTNLAMYRPQMLVAIDRLPELRTLRATDERIEIGAAVTLSEAESWLAGRVPLLDALFPQFASRLIRNAATFGGNLGTASPIGDGAPALLALDATLTLASTEGTREVALSDYFTGYRQTVRRPGELIATITVPVAQPGMVAFHKIAKRRYDDISSVAVAYALDIEGGVVTRARIGLGGVAATPLRALATEAALTGSAWTEAEVDRVAEVLAGEGTPLGDHRASEAYRRAMLGTSLRKLYAEHAPATTGATR